MNFEQIMDLFKNFQSQFEKIRKDLQHLTFEGTSGAGMVIAKVNGNLELLELKISDEVLSMNDKALLENLIIGAINQALDKAKSEGALNFQKFLNPLAGSFGIDIK
ncbi:MAG: YbaB/EbfC family nucleoid-associated protein [Ignavibacteria bacterium]|nr:YbaB/EbfC family nucleoid-associated protein [Ignavibacteria bacterium]